METTTIMSIPTAHEDLSSKNVATPDDAGLAFLALARDLEPYLDDFTRQSTFKNFLDLPNELQYHVYEDYLCDNASALATAYMDPFSRDDVDYQDEGMAAGRYLYWDDILDDETKDILKETGTHLLGSFTLIFNGAAALLHFFETANHLRAPGFSIAHSVRKIIVCNVNGMNFAQALYQGNRTTRSIDMRTVKTNNRAVSMTFNACRGLQHLCIEFHSPCEYKFGHSTSLKLDAPDATALHIGQYLDDFNPRSISALPKLRRLTIYGTSGLKNVADILLETLKYPEIKIDTVENLQPLSKLAAKLRESFKGKDQNVDITTCLQWDTEKEIHQEDICN